MIRYDWLDDFPLERERLRAFHLRVWIGVFVIVSAVSLLLWRGP